MTKLIFTDPHITEQAIPELEEIFKEIFKQNADILIMVGDYYHKKRPTAREIIFGTKWAHFFRKKFKKVIFLRGNHDRTENVSAIDYLEYLGIEVVDEYIDDGAFFGHFMTNKSLYEYGTYEKTVEELGKYEFVVLGHQHVYQKLSNNIIHLGSCRYVNFDEVNDDRKYIMFNFGKAQWQRMKLDSPIPMKDVKSIKELGSIKTSNMKVRLVIGSYEQFKEEINEIAKYKNKFQEFKVKLDFKKEIHSNEQIVQKNEQKKLEDILRQGIEKIEDKDVKKLLKEAMK